MQQVSLPSALHATPDHISTTAVGAHLALYHFTLKTDTPSAFDPRLSEPLPEKLTLSSLSPSQEWNTGVVYAQAQNLARTVRVLASSHESPLTCAGHSSWSSLRT